jgi:hypothetical protein
LKLWKIEHKPQYHDRRWKRRFKIDVYLPQYKIGLEVDGSFKYNKEGVISPYYSKRATLIFESSGIVIVHIPHTKVVGLTKKDLMLIIKNNKAS